MIIWHWFGLKRQLEAWIGHLKSEGLRVNFMKMKIMVDIEKAKKVNKEHVFLCSLQKRCRL